MLESHPPSICICLKRLSDITAQTLSSKPGSFPLLQSIQPNRASRTARNAAPLENREAKIHENR